MEQVIKQDQVSRTYLYMAVTPGTPVNVTQIFALTVDYLGYRTERRASAN